MRPTQPVTSSPNRLVMFGVVGIYSLFLVALLLTNRSAVMMVGAFLLLGALTITYALSSFIRRTKQDRISETYRLEVPAVQTYPEYKIPPEEDIRAALRFGCAPLIDCCFPLLLQQLDPHTWMTLVRSHAIDVHIRIADFNRLLDAVHSSQSDSGVDLVVASAASIDRVRFPHGLRGGVVENAPVAVLPILQQFNAYYLFGKRSEIIEFLNEHNYHWAAERCAAASGTATLHMLVAEQSVGMEGILGDILKEFPIHVERGADLDAAIAFYGKELNPTHSVGTFISVAATNSIESTFEAFLADDQHSLFMGGLAQSAYLLRRCGVGDEYVIVAGPNDIAYPNVNSLVCSKELAHDRPNDVFRFIGWWFDVLNCFRRLILFEETRDPELYKKAVDMILEGLETEGGRMALVPPAATPADVEAMLDMLRIRSADEIGNYMLPNIHEALGVRTALIDNLRSLDAVVDLVPKVPLSEGVSGLTQSATSMKAS